MVTVVLIETSTPGNIGAIARAMKNFGLSEMVLINPRCDHLSHESISRAKYAKEIVKKAKVADFSYLKKFDALVATTAMIGTDYNIPRSPITPEQLADVIPNKGKTALVFGRDTFGLTNEEIQMCDFVVAIPSSKTYPTMNISHAACVIFYELFKKTGKDKLNENVNLATKKDKEILLKFINDKLDMIDFSTKEKKDTQIIVWKRVIGKSFLTKREAFALMGFFRKLKRN